MHTQQLHRWQHNHDLSVIQEHGEKRTVQVLFLTAATMVVEIVGGLTFGSMALLADGWYMGTHVAAFSITIFAYGMPSATPTARASASERGKSACWAVLPVPWRWWW